MANNPKSDGVIKMSGKGLGRGLDALFGDSAAVSEQNQGPRMIPIMQIEPNGAQPRKNFNEESLSELANSIKQNGVITPITVRRLSSGQYQIIAGRASMARCKACRAYGNACRGHGRG